jgi:hypothetical protein
VSIAADVQDHAFTLARATGHAMSNAEERVPRGDGWTPAKLRALGEAVEISLELAGPLVPFHAVTYVDVDLGVRPGLEGVAARFGDRVAATFPSALLVGGLQPSEALRAAISEASGDPLLALDGAINGQPGQIEKQRGATFYRFKTAHLAQCGQGLRPLFLHRGGLVTDRRGIDRAAIEAMRVGMDRHLEQRLERREKDGTLDVRAVQFPTREQDAGGSASAFDRALASYALLVSDEARFDSDIVRPGTPGDDVSRAGAMRVLERSRKAIESLAAEAGATSEVDAQGVKTARAMDAVTGAMNVVLYREADRFTARVAAACGVNAADARGVAPSASWASESLEAARSAFDAERGWGKDVEVGAQGLIAYSLMLGATSKAEHASASKAVRSIYMNTTPGRIVAQMPWLGWAELELAGKTGEIGPASALREMRQQLFEHQMTEFDAGEEDADLAGGFVFTASGNPYPTWQSVRPLPFLATMLADSRLTDEGERMKELSRLMGSVRFLRQLCADVASGHMYPARGRAMWGVRAAAWDQRQPIEATAMGLIGVCEVLRAVDGMGAKR